MTYSPQKRKTVLEIFFKNLNPTLKDNLSTYRQPFITNYYCKGLVTFHIMSLHAEQQHYYNEILECATHEKEPHHARTYDHTIYLSRYFCYSYVKNVQVLWYDDILIKCTAGA